MNGSRTIAAVGSDDAPRSRERQLSSALHHWATGISSGIAGRVTLWEAGAARKSALGSGGAEDVHLIPRTDLDASDRSDHEGPGAAKILTFDGRFQEPGDVMHIGGGYEIELMDYLVAPFMQIARPTIVSCVTSAAWQAFIEDADEARASGMFIPQLTSSSLVLADSSVMHAAIDGTTVDVNRLTVGADGGARYRLAGPVLASIDEIDLAAQPPAAFLFSEGESPEAGAVLAEEFAARPWIRRYLAALRVLGGPDGDAWSVSGFGADLTSRHPDAAHRRSGHVIIWRGEQYQLVLDSGRRFALSREAAIAIECLLESPTRERALAAARESGLTRPSVERELDDLSARLASAGVTRELDGAR